MNRQLKEREEGLQALQQQHGRLKDASMDTIKSLQQTLQGLEKSCADLQVTEVPLGTVGMCMAVL